jgi:hypothetical protein
VVGWDAEDTSVDPVPEAEVEGDSGLDPTDAVLAGADT